jgi:FkbM family methyltransferase
MQEEQEIQDQLNSAEKALNTVAVVDCGDGGKLTFFTINTTTYRRALALVQTPEQNNLSEPETTRWINEFEEGATLLDIGANVGIFTVYAAVIKKAKVYSFEPSSQNFFLLNRNILANNLSDMVTPFPIALSNENKIDFLYLSSLEIGDSGNSAGEDTNFLLQERTSGLRHGTAIATIDRLIEDGLIESPDHIKIDVDGIEPKILQGATNLLASGKVKSLLVELTDQLPQHIEAIQLLGSFGYQSLPEETEKNRVKDPQWHGSCNYIFRLGR